jgi:hypothetical protein
VLWLILAALFAGAVAHVSLRWGREAALRQQRESPTAGVVGAFPVMVPADGAPPARYRVTGVSRETGEAVELRLDAASPAHASYKADLHRVRVHAAVKLDDDDAPAGGASVAGPAVGRGDDGNHDAPGADVPPPVGAATQWANDARHDKDDGQIA